MPSLPPIALNLIAARKLIKRGWCKGTYSKKRVFRNSAYCILGAVREITGDCSSESTEIEFLSIVIREKIREWHNSYLTSQFIVKYYNDDKAKDKSEVLRIFDRATELAVFGN